MSACEAEEDEFEGLTVQKKNGVFECAWRNFQSPGIWALTKWKTMERDESCIPDVAVLDRMLPVLSVNKERLKQPTGDKIQVTWIGHATILVQFDGINILSDPLFCDIPGSANVGEAGTKRKRYRSPACQVDDLPRIDVVIISHDHYDHLNIKSIKAIGKRFPNVKWFCGSGTKSLLCYHGCNGDNVIPLTWWEKYELCTLPQGQSNPNVHAGSQDGMFQFVCVPAQHWSQRFLFDRNKRLWCGWTIIGPKHRFYYAGDTGYYSKLFKKIGEKYGPFDLSAIPIGSYHPRYMMEYQHVTPVEAVEIHRDVRSQNSISIHWGTFNMGYEWYLEPPNLLYSTIEQLKRKGEDPKPFVSLNLGETWDVGTPRDLPPFIMDQTTQDFTQSLN